MGNKRASSGPSIDPTAVLNSLISTVIVIDPENRIIYTNGAAENFLGGSSAYLRGKAIATFVPGDSPLFGLVDQVRAGSNRVSEYGVQLSSPRIGHHLVNIHAVPLHEVPGSVIVTLHERSIADQLDRQMSQRGAVRSLTGLASMLAHEVKNPLSGIRGAAQLLEADVPEDDRPLTRLICDEADRIVAMIDTMEAFSDQGIPDRGPVNIHEVLERVHKVASSGFGRHVRFVEEYDPSLPPVLGHFDSLVQVFLNLVKNAAESVPEEGGEIILHSAYRHGVRFALAGRGSRVHLPLMVTVRDNGPGIPEDIRPHLFDAFVTTKRSGKGLGLALVAKIVDDHGGVIEFDSDARGTEFRVMLPMARIIDPGKRRGGQ